MVQHQYRGAALGTTALVRDQAIQIKIELCVQLADSTDSVLKMKVFAITSFLFKLGAAFNFLES